MASVEITTSDISKALRRTLVDRTIAMFNQNYTPGPEHEKKCDGYWVSEELYEDGISVDWDAERNALRVTLSEVPCYCYRYVDEATLHNAFGVGELFLMLLGER
jgi:hypothetical protein